MDVHMNTNKLGVTKEYSTYTCVCVEYVFMCARVLRKSSACVWWIPGVLAQFRLASQLGAFVSTATDLSLPPTTHVELSITLGPRQLQAGLAATNKNPVPVFHRQLDCSVGIWNLSCTTWSLSKLAISNSSITAFYLVVCSLLCCTLNHIISPYCSS